MWRLVSLLFITIVFGSFGQYNWTWTEMQQMPFRTSNNAVCEASVGGNEFVYSFGGIDTSKAYSGIHQRAFKYDVTSNEAFEADFADFKKIDDVDVFFFVAENDEIYPSSQAD